MMIVGYYNIPCNRLVRPLNRVNTRQKEKAVSPEGLMGFPHTKRVVLS